MKRIPFTSYTVVSHAEAVELKTTLDDGARVIEWQNTAMLQLMAVNNALAAAIDSIPCECHESWQGDELCSRCKAVQRASAAISEFA